MSSVPTLRSIDRATAASAAASCATRRDEETLELFRSHVRGMSARWPARARVSGAEPEIVVLGRLGCGVVSA